MKGENGRGDISRTLQKRTPAQTKVSETPISKNKLGVEVHFVISAMQEAKIRGSWSKDGPRQWHEILPKKVTEVKRLGCSSDGKVFT
jgi:hypothetical protein